MQLCIVNVSRVQEGLGSMRGPFRGRQEVGRDGGEPVLAEGIASVKTLRLQGALWT